jgi:hypothetical protein
VLTKEQLNATVAHIDFLTPESFEQAFAELKRRRQQRDEVSSFSKESESFISMTVHPHRVTDPTGRSPLPEALVMCGACDKPKQWHNGSARKVNGYFVCSRPQHEVGTNTEGAWSEIPVEDEQGNWVYDLVDMSVRPKHLRDESHSPRMERRLRTKTRFLIDYQFILKNNSIHTAELPKVLPPEDSTYEEHADIQAAWQDQYESPTKEWERLDKWRDKAPQEHTITLEQYRKGLDHLDPEEVTPETQTVFLQGEAMLTVELSPEAIAKAQARMLGVWRDRDGNLAMGSVYFLSNTDGTVTARCKNRDCHAHYPGLTVNPDTMTQADKENFTFQVIEHGFRHSLTFDTEFLMVESPAPNEPSFTKRKRTLPVPFKGDATTSWTTFSLPQEKADVDLLFDHQKYCNNTDCKCSLVLAKELAL